MLSHIDRVKCVEERFKKIHTGGVGKEATFRDESQGWWLVTESGPSLYLGVDAGGFKEGDTIKLSISKVT